jgi:hypothetical protein
LCSTEADSLDSAFINMSVPTCRLLYFTSLAFNQTTDVVLELSTPPKGAHDDGVAFCFMGANYILSNSTATANVTVGGNQFDTSFLRRARIDVLEFASFWEIMANDTTFQDLTLLR